LASKGRKVGAVGLHWTPYDVAAHVDTLLTSWVVGIALAVFGCIYRPRAIVEYVADITRTQAIFIEFIPLVGGLFIFILGANWAGSLFPWSLVELPKPSEEASAPTNDINTTVCLALLSSHATFYVGFTEYHIGYPAKYLKPVSFIAPLNVLEEFSKPLSLSFRLLGNILADELTLAVLYGLVPLGVPIPVFLLGLFTSGIQAVVFATLAAAYLGETLESLAS
jgi:F-type H+-transporting ATPase subunit a